MNNLFFQITDSTMKLRRNLLLTASLGILHFWMEKLQTLKVLDIQFDGDFLNLLIPISLVWFLFNYLLQFYAEYTQWKVDALNEAISEHNLSQNNWKGRTINSSIKELSKEKIRIESNFSTSIHAPKANFSSDTNLEKQIKTLMENIDKQIKGAIEADVTRIDAFHNALSKFNFANRFRFYVLDLAIPILYSLLSILPLLKSVSFF